MCIHTHSQIYCLWKKTRTFQRKQSRAIPFKMQKWLLRYVIAPKSLGHTSQPCLNVLDISSFPLKYKPPVPDSNHWMMGWWDCIYYEQTLTMITIYMHAKLFPPFQLQLHLSWYYLILRKEHVLINVITPCWRTKTKEIFCLYQKSAFIYNILI